MKGVTKFQKTSLKNSLRLVERETSEKSTVEEGERPKKEYVIKIIVAGDGGVGKTSLLNRYISNEFVEGMKLTVGTDFFTHVFDCKGRTVKIQVWDFGGEPRFRFILPDYCKGACGVLLAFDLNDFATLINLNEWLQIIRENVADSVTILVGTKADNAEFLDEETIKQFCIINEIDEFIPTSSKTGENVDFVFYELIRRIIARKISFGGVK